MLKRTIPTAGLAVLPRTGHTANLRAHRGLGQQHRLAGEHPQPGDGPAEHAEEGIGRTVVVAVLTQGDDAARHLLGRLE